VPQLEHEAPRSGFAHRGDRRVVEVVAVRSRGDLARARGGHVEAEGLVHARRALLVRQRRQGDDLLERELRQPLGHEQAAARGDALEDGLRERARAVAETAGVQVADHAPGIVPHAAGRGFAARPSRLAHLTSGNDALRYIALQRYSKGTT
jgi:sRNA-binding protein